MLKKLAYFASITILLTLAIVSCENENKGYREYYNSMGNNPVQVVPWLIDIRKSLDKKESRISWYKLDNKNYYTVQSFIPTDSVVISPYSIYEANEKKEIVYFHSDNILKSDQSPNYIYFIENAALVDLLWSNEGQYTTAE